jgi:hypothetical protein
MSTLRKMNADSHRLLELAHLTRARPFDKRAEKRFKEIVEDLIVQYADEKHLLWNEVRQALTASGQHELATRFQHMRERGILLEKLRLLCDPRTGEGGAACDVALTHYLHVSRGSPPPPTRNGHVALEAFVSGLPATPLRDRAMGLLHGLYEQKRDVVLTKRERPQRQQTDYKFQLLRPGEAEHVARTRTSYIALDFVNGRREYMNTQVQEGAVELSILHRPRTVQVEAFARDLSVREPRGGDKPPSRMRLLMCLALAVVALDLQREGRPGSYTVDLVAADEGSGKLISYYAGFGLRPIRAGSRTLEASLDEALRFCIG